MLGKQADDCWYFPVISPSHCRTEGGDLTLLVRQPVMTMGLGKKTVHCLVRFANLKDCIVTWDILLTFEFAVNPQGGTFQMCNTDACYSCKRKETRKKGAGQR